MFEGTINILFTVQYCIVFMWQNERQATNENVFFSTDEK